MTDLLPEPTPAKLIERYVKLRDEKKANEDRYAVFMREHFGDPMEELEIKLLDMLNKAGGDSLATPAGTVYRSEKVSLTTADAREFRRHIIGGELWDLVDWRPAKTAINELVETGEPLPPGLNRSVFVTANVRRPTK
jgi:hypothetical protein